MAVAEQHHVDVSPNGGSAIGRRFDLNPVFRSAILAATGNPAVSRLVREHGMRLGAARFVAGESFDEAMTDLTKDEIKAFEQATNCKVEITKFDQLRLSSSLAAGSPPDLVRTDGAPSMPNLMARGLCENLDPYFAKSSVLKPDDFEAITNVYRYDGTKTGTGSIYGFPIDYSQDAMLWFNQELFDKAGVPLPDTTAPITNDEFLALGKQLTTRSGGKINVFGGDFSWNEGQNHPRIAQMVAQQGASLWSEDLETADFTQPAAVKAMQWLVDWSQARIGTGPLDPAPDWNGPLYNANRVAMISFGYWFRGWVNGVSSGEDTHGLIDRSVFAPAPQIGDTRVDACFNGTGCWIPAKAKQKDLAFAFMELWFGGEPAKRHFQGGAGLPPLKSQFALLPQASETDKRQFETQKANLANFSLLTFSKYAPSAALEDIITKSLQPAMTGSGKLEDGIRQLQAGVEKAIKDGKSQIGG